LIYTAARGGAVAKLRLHDNYANGHQWWYRFDEKGSKARTIPARHDVELYIEAYVRAAGIEKEAEDTPLFCSTMCKTKLLTTRAMTANDIYRMVKRRLRDALLPSRHLSCHSFWATAITDLLTQECR
jgi:integrase